jgi:cell division protease FtsH
MGGRVAECLIFGYDGVTTGASSDLQHVAELSRQMVSEEGLGNKLRDQVFNSDEVNFFGDRARTYSEKTSERIDAEILELNREARSRAEAVLKANSKLLDTLAEALLEKETLEADEVDALLKDAKLPAEAKLHA